MQISMQGSKNVIDSVADKATGTFRFFASGQFIVSFVRWLVTTGGNVAESAFLLATLWVTINNVAHLIVSWVLPESIIQILNQVAVISFSVLPELIIFAAIKVTFDHWQMFYRSRDKMALAWAIAYTPFTLCFAIMTILVLSSFVSVQATADVSPQASGVMLVIRCLAGWGYGVIQMLFASIGKQGYTSIFDRLNSTIQSTNTTLQDRDNTIAGLQNNLVSLQQKTEEQEKELLALRMSLAEKRLIRKSVTRVPEQMTTEENVTEDGAIEYSACDNGESLTVTGRELTVVATGEKRRRLKESLQAAILQGEKINLKEISQRAGVSYGMARNLKKTLIEEIKADTGAMLALASPAAPVSRALLAAQGESEATE